MANLITCAACSHQISAEATSCPNCGHPTGVGIYQRFESVEKGHKALSLVVSFLLLGGQATLLKLFGMSPADAKEISLLAVFFQTAPFTIAVAIIILVAIKDRAARSWEGFFFAAIILVGSVFLNSYLTGKGSATSMLGNPLKMFVSTLEYYWQLYGASLFISSLLLGGFIAWSIHKFWPRKAQE